MRVGLPARALIRFDVLEVGFPAGEKTRANFRGAFVADKIFHYAVGSEGHGEELVMHIDARSKRADDGDETLGLHRAMHERVGVRRKAATSPSDLIRGTQQLPNLRLCGHAGPNLFHCSGVEFSIHANARDKQETGDNRHEREILHSAKLN